MKKPGRRSALKRRSQPGRGRKLHNQRAAIRAAHVGRGALHSRFAGRGAAAVTRTDRLPAPRFVARINNSDPLEL